MKPAWSDIKILVLDFDGVLTDGFVYVDQDGRESVRCSRRDSLGIGMLKEKGVPTVVISKEKNGVVAARCAKLGIECHSGIDDKLTVLKALLQEKGIDAAQACYVGDDANDAECLRFAGLGVAVADALPPAKAVADHITDAKGGDHAVREVCDHIYASRA
jgi:YrbI family 3-deoxy-D-manno-octulosonate 8-phosphate phosphatase